MKIKIIDLLVKQANNEEMPKHIKVYNEDWYWNDYDGYVNKQSLSTAPDAQIYLAKEYRLDFALNKDVEIIEEPKKIENISDEELEQCDGDYDRICLILDRLDEIIDYINKGDNNE